MRTLKFHQVIYNLDKFIGIDIINNLDVTPGHYNVLFRFEGDYLTEHLTDESTPYSMDVGIGRHTMYHITEDAEIEDVVDTFVELLNEALCDDACKCVNICEIREKAYEIVSNKN